MEKRTKTNLIKRFLVSFVICSIVISNVSVNAFAVETVPEMQSENTLNEDPVLTNGMVDGEPEDIEGNPDDDTFEDIMENPLLDIVTETDSASFMITTSVEGGTIDPSITVNKGDSKTINYQPDKDSGENYVLVSVTVDGIDVDITKYPDSYMFEDIEEDHDIHVVYKKQYTIYTTAGTDGGTIDPSITVNEGDTVTIHYAPDKGCALFRVIVDGKDLDIKEYPDSYTFENIDGNHFISVAFGIMYSVTTSVENGTIDPSESIIIGLPWEVHYQPNPGYVIESLTVGYESRLSAWEWVERVYDKNEIKEYGYTSSYGEGPIFGNYSIHVVFKKANYIITTSVEGGTIDPDATANEGDSKTIKYQPNEGYVLVSVMVNGEPVDITQYPDSYTFENITEDYGIHVVYEKKKYPDDLDKPTDSEDTNKPETPDEPETSDKPEISDKPETSDKPEISDEPETSDKLETSDEPKTPEKPETPDKPGNSDIGNSNTVAPKTGDSTNIALWVFLMLAAIVFIGVLAGERSKKKASK